MTEGRGAGISDMERLFQTFYESDVVLLQKIEYYTVVLLQICYLCAVVLLQIYD